MGFIQGKSDPYVKAYMDAENQFRTKTVQDNLSPKWNHVDYFRVYRNDDGIQFNLFDEDVDADDDLGKVIMKPSKLKEFLKRLVPT